MQTTTQPIAQPCILTQVSHAGVSALDLATVPHNILVAIASAALVVAADWNNGNIKAEMKDAEELLAALSSTVDNLDVLYQPVVPGREDLMGIGLTVADDEDGYPVIRGDHMELVKAVDLTPIEKAAVRQHLQFNMRAGEESAESFKDRLAQFEREIA
ncbi:MAG: hypothetical protein ABS37_00455 [Acidovorax sp. SCN 65-108]|nr:MAG: hypothetical protein ABS37_00455 [Acidovorax sp. SCN 65-108]OJV73538.1 MAG: hypothetical protein BGO35_13195 [Burkholderiales bacterium 64-34]